MSEEFLDHQLCRDLRDAINETDIFIFDSIEKRHFNLVCAVLDRLDSAISYLNHHSTHPTTEEDLVCFVVYACMVTDAIKSVLKELGVPNPYEPANGGKEFFRDICTTAPMNLTEADIPTDDRFFDYLRALMFAHPFETNRQPFLRKKHETQYSPFAIANSHDLMGTAKGSIKLCVYSNITDDPMYISISFSLLKDYIASRYNLLTLVTDRVNATIQAKEDIWRQRKVRRDRAAIDIYKEIAAILDERYAEPWDVDEAITYLTCETTLPANDEFVDLFRRELTGILPALCDAIDDLDCVTFFQAIGEKLQARPRNMHQKGHYQLEKIHSYLNDDSGDSNQAWGRQQADDFSREFAAKWVTIDAQEMSFPEIRLLVSAACYFEHQATKAV